MPAVISAGGDELVCQRSSEGQLHKACLLVDSSPPAHTRLARNIPILKPEPPCPLYARRSSRGVSRCLHPAPRQFRRGDGDVSSCSPECATGVAQVISVRGGTAPTRRAHRATAIIVWRRSVPRRRTPQSGTPRRRIRQSPCRPPLRRRGVAARSSQIRGRSLALPRPG
jgi:hypothetical protein